ncbi:ribosome maturation factor RimM [Aestuariibacter halophilus]|uniref:Ribosome maturation factor RimM n=1 Tax=Fluctibacter halophilus TaxID=226011 RepID=A0ABS8G415_9ALTE|nr:ribosome maturation factor RimM [Aestuariibacter halophilus]MCC2615183.1 ribosome maturation factor RimM [Aestuariibacter halophilus]
MSQASDTVVIGKIGAPYGVKGWVKINSYTDQREGVFDYSPWLVGENGQEYRVDHWKTHSKSVVAKLEGVDNRDQADSLKNLDIAIKASQLPQLADDEYYWRDLVGMQVVTENGYDLGVVKDMFETGANDVMLVKAKSNDAFGQKERMLPFLFDQVIKHVDKQQKVIKVDWDPGF